MLNSRLILTLQSNKLLKAARIYKNRPSVIYLSDWVPKEQETHTGQVISFFKIPFEPEILFYRCCRNGKRTITD